jgi:hypothetical protein
VPRPPVVKLVGITVGGLVGLVALAVLAAWALLQGPRLGRLIGKSLPENRGKLEIGGVRWHLRALIDLATDAPSPIAVDGLRIIDPDGQVVLDVPHLEARVQLRTILKGSFAIHELRAATVNWRFAATADGKGIGFLAALEPRHPPPPLPPGAKPAPPGPGSFFQLIDAQIGDLNAVFDFPGAWGLELRHTRLTASLIQSTVDPAHPIFGFDVSSVVAQGGGKLSVLDGNVLPLDRVAIQRVATTQDRPDDIFLDLTGADRGRSRLLAKGYFTGIYGATSVTGIDLHAEIADAGDLLGAAVKARQIAGLSLGGRAASVRLELSQTFDKLRVTGAFRGLDVRYADYRALGLGFDLGFDAAQGVVEVKQLGFGAPEGGRLELDARLRTDTLALTLGARAHELRTDSYLPRGLGALGRGALSGRLQVAANLARKSLDIQQVDLRLDRSRRGSLPRSIRVHGAARLSPTLVETSGLVVDVTGANATLKGKLELDSRVSPDGLRPARLARAGSKGRFEGPLVSKQLVQASLTVLAFDLGRLLGELGLPPLAKDARLQATVGGTLDQPTAGGTAVVRGLGAQGRSLPELDARFSLRDGVARLESLSGRAFGGTLSASGALRLYQQTTRRMLRSPEVDLRVAGRGLDLSALAGSAALAGSLSFDARAQGALDALTAELHIPPGGAVRVLGEDYQLGPVEVGLTAERLEVRRLHLTRKAGGALDLHGTVGLAHHELGVEVVLNKIPLQGLPALADSGMAITGLISARLQVTGTLERPLLAGDIALGGVTARGVKLGDGRLTLAPVPRGEAPRKSAAAALAGAVRISGDLFDRFHINGTAAIGPQGPAVHGVMEFQRVALEALVPELGELGDGRGLASGRVAVDIEPGRPLALDLLLQELAFSVARQVEGASGETTVQRLHVRAAHPIHAVVKDGAVVLDEVLLSTDGGDLRAQGRLGIGAGANGRALEGRMSGHLSMEILQPFLRASVERMSGDLAVELAAAGTLDRPLLRGRIDILDAIKLRPKGFESDVSIGSGSFQLDERSVQVAGVALTVDGSTVRLSGQASLGPGFRPENLRADLDGDISARLLSYVTPDAVSDTQGTARVHATIRGTLERPEVRGRLDLGNIDLRVRDLGTEVQIQSGVVEIANDGAILHDVKVHLDDGGVLVIGASGVRPGRIAFSRLVPFEPGKVDLPLHGERLTFHSTDTYAIDDLAFDLDLHGSVDAGFTLGGEVRLVSGRYLQDFKVQSLVLSPRVNEAAVRPFYAGKPLLEGLRLDLGVRTVGDGFVVQDNLAPEIHVDVVLNIGGTLAAPVLAGDVRPTDGRFHFPAMRGDFDLVADANHVTFIATKSLAEGDTPELDIQAVNLLTDASGADHNVRIRIHGPIREAQIDLSTDDGLDRNQTAMLLLTGRTSTDSQRFGTQNPTVGANINTAADVGDQLLRDTVANLMEPYISDDFEKLTGLILRPSVGPNGFDVRVSKNISRYLIFRAETLLGFQNQSHQSLQLDLWLMDYLRLGGGLERITLSSEQGIPETLPLNGSFELRWDFAIRR